MASKLAPIKWAQRSDSVYITIACPDVKDADIKLTDTELHFKGKSEDKDYEVAIEFFEQVDAEGSTYNVLPRSVQMHVMKKATDSDFWPRLLKDKLLEKNQVAIDWDRYVDEDEEDEAGGFDMSNMAGGQGMGGMGDMGGMGGMGGMDMEALMKQMGGMGGMEGMGGAGGMPDYGDDEDDDGDDDIEDLPELEDNE